MAESETELQREIERVDAGGDAWDGSEPLNEPVRVKRPLDTILRVRFSSDQYRRIEALADEAGVGPSTLLRMWTLQRLKEPAHPSPA